MSANVRQQPWTERKWICVVPVVACLALCAGRLSLNKRVLHVHTVELTPACPMSDLPELAVEFSRFLVLISTYVLCVVFMILALTISIHMTYRSFLRLGCRTAILLLLLTATVGMLAASVSIRRKPKVLLLSLPVSDQILADVREVHVCSPVGHCIIRIQQVGWWIEGSGFIVTWFILAVGCGLLAPYAPWSGVEKADQLLTEIGRLNILLYLGSGLLAMHAMRTSAVIRWSAVFFDPTTRTQTVVDDLAASTAGYEGVFYSLLLLTLYALPAVVLSSRARRHAQGIHPRAPALQRKWLTEHGFEITLAGWALRVVAVMAPVLTGNLDRLLSRSMGP